MFEDTDAVKHGTRILISKHNPHRVCGKCWTHPRGIPNCSLFKEHISLVQKLDRKNPNLLKNRQGGLLYTTQSLRQPVASPQITFFCPFWAFLLPPEQRPEQIIRQHF
jgi:hypothetical protein